jgi:phosphorylcholine metabolism protein LicD
LKFLIPARIKSFLFDYDHSIFVECDQNLSIYNENCFQIRQNQQKNEIMLNSIAYISNSFESLSKHYWLAGGTLLGWYRNCGIIPYTHDVDFAIWFDEYDQSVKNHFEKNETVKLIKEFGTLNDSYELRLVDMKYSYDIFITYKIGKEKQWCGYQMRKKYM